MNYLPILHTIIIPEENLFVKIVKALIKIEG